MTQRKINVCGVENHSKPSKKNSITEKTDVYHIDDTWSLNVIDLKVYASENNIG